MKSLPGIGPDLPPIRGSRIVGGQQQQDFGLQRIGILKLINKQALEPLLKAPSHLRVVSNQIASLEKQVKKVERAGLGLCLLILLRTRAKLVVQ